MKEAEAGLAVVELIRKYAASEQTYYRWKSRFDGMELSDAKRLKQSEEENRRLKKLVADKALDIQILKEVNVGKY